jgi:hypothetical protein
VGFGEPPVKYAPRHRKKPVSLVENLPKRGLPQGGIDVPHNSATNNATLMPTGAMKVVRDFSAACIKTTKTSNEVRDIPMNTPWAIEMPFVNRMTTAMSRGTCTSNELRAIPLGRRPFGQGTGRRRESRVECR